MVKQSTSPPYEPYVEVVSAVAQLSQNAKSNTLPTPEQIQLLSSDHSTMQRLFYAALNGALERASVVRANDEFSFEANGTFNLDTDPIFKELAQHDRGGLRTLLKVANAAGLTPDDVDRMTSEQAFRTAWGSRRQMLSVLQARDIDLNAFVATTANEPKFSLTKELQALAGLSEAGNRYVLKIPEVFRLPDEQRHAVSQAVLEQVWDVLADEEFVEQLKAAQSLTATVKGPDLSVDEDRVALYNLFADDHRLPGSVFLAAQRMIVPLLADIARQTMIDKCGELNIKTDSSSPIDRGMMEARGIYIGGHDHASFDHDLPPTMVEVVGQDDALPTYADVVGLEHPKYQLQVSMLKLLMPERFNTPAGNIILNGAPGVGKTHLVRAAAGEIRTICAQLGRNINVVAVDLADIFEMWVGSTNKNLNQLIEFLRELQPAIAFFDEIESVLKQRNYSTHETTHRALVKFLKAISGGIQDKLDRLAIVGATNNIELMDPAARRAGRFTNEIYIPMPTETMLTTMLHTKTDALKQKDIPLAIGAECFATISQRHGTPEGKHADVEAWNGSDIDGLVTALDEWWGMQHLTSSDPPTQINDSRFMQIYDQFRVMRANATEKRAKSLYLQHQEPGTCSIDSPFNTAAQPEGTASK